MFCPNCGNRSSDTADICLYCGAPLRNNSGNTNYNRGENDKSNAGLNILSFFIPLVGLILYIALKRETPIKAKACGKSALFGVGAIILLYVITFFLTGRMINREIEEAKHELLIYYSESVADKAEDEYYLDFYFNDNKNEKCYNISELYNYETDYKGSVKVEQKDNSINIKVWLTYKDSYIIAEYEDGRKINEEIIESSKINLNCSN